MPENTISAIIKALDEGITTLEMYIVIARDSQAIICHEPFFNHEISTLPDGSFISEAEEKKFNICEMAKKAGADGINTDYPDLLR